MTRSGDGDGDGDENGDGDMEGDGGQHFVPGLWANKVKWAICGVFLSVCK